ncbi:MAG: NADH-quinone oxidoreductase subunit NuoF [Planctomycetota bacterium]|jgi:NADH-quinone oxidoreductase subunit F
MEKLGSIDSFFALKERLLIDLDREKPTVVISAGTCGQASGANDLIRASKREIIANNLIDKINLRITGCHGFCQMEPSVLVLPEGNFYPHLDPKGMAEIIAAVAKGEVVDGLLYRDEETGQPVRKQSDIPFFRHQVRTILGRNEMVDPIRIYNYIENGGYSSFVKIINEHEPEWVIEQVKKSGLRGRGGAGFPTGLKWEFLANSGNGHGKYLVCNADEGDPGAYMDRSVLEGNPHSILEGMLIAAYATGATEGVLYVRTEYPLAIKHLLIALRQAREIGLLGKKILKGVFSFDITLVRGAGAFVCGEETALMASIEGKMGEPRQRPPYPIEKGIYGKPTAINNVETWANIPVIFEKGSEEFAKVGTPGNSGTKIFSLVGKVKNTGLVEVPMGATFGTIVDEIGGGSPGKTGIKAVQTGGPSGGCIPAAQFDLQIDYDSLAKAGSIMGSGGMIVIDEETCMVDVAKYYMNFLKDESCGKCYTCRKGTQRMWEILDDVSNGKSSLEQLDLLKELAVVVKDASMCGLGQTASNPVLSTIRNYRDEYLQHIEKGCCPAHACRELITYSINDNCTGCVLCIKACPQGAITGKKKEKHVIDSDKCIKCDACRSVCKFDGVTVV